MVAAEAVPPAPYPAHHEASLASLEPDAFTAICEHLSSSSVAALAASSTALRHAVASNDRLWSGLYHSHFPAPWRRLTAWQAERGRGAGVAPGGWRDVFLATHDACQQLISSEPCEREWTTDATAVHFASIHGSGAQRFTLTAQGSGIELRCSPEVDAAKSFQLYGHTARVSSAAVLAPPGATASMAAHRIGVVSASHDQTVRLWSLNVDPESYDFTSQRISLLTPLRTLRGHQEAVTCLQLLASGTGVTIAATSSKDRTVRLWGLAPLIPSPVHKPQIATLRGHGAPVTCMALAGGDGRGGSNCSGSWLLSGSLDTRVKQWDPWTAACVGTAKCAAPVTAMQAAAGAPALQPLTLLVAGGAGVQLLDIRSMRPVGGVALPAERAEAVHCFCQLGWDLAVGASDGARVFDLRGGSSGNSSSGSGSGSGTAGRGLPERLRLMGHARPVTSIHVDRHKVVTATDCYGPAPVRVWCADVGECLTELGSRLPTPQPDSTAAAQEGGQEGGQDGGEQPGGSLEGGHGQQLGEPQNSAAAAAAAGRDGQGGGSSTSRPHHQYHRSWEGVTALAVRGSLLVSGSSEGAVVERDFRRGGLPEAEDEWGDSGGLGGLGGKFWQPFGSLAAGPEG